MINTLYMIYTTNYATTMGKNRVIINRKPSIFNTLPLEIINLIFENIKIKDLCELKFICSYWSIIIREIINSRLKIEKLHIPNEKKINAIDTTGIIEDGYETYHSMFTNLELYYTRNNYLLNNLTEDEEILKFITKKLGVNDIYDNYIGKKNHETFLDHVEKSCNNHKESVWKILIAVTGSYDLLEKLENNNYKDKFMQSFMNNYELYLFRLRGYPDYIRCIPDFKNHEEFYESFEAGGNYVIIVVYPDKKTFSLHHEIWGRYM